VLTNGKGSLASAYVSGSSTAKTSGLDQSCRRVDRITALKSSANVKSAIKVLLKRRVLTALFRLECQIPPFLSYLRHKDFLI